MSSFFLLLLLILIHLFFHSSPNDCLMFLFPRNRNKRSVLFMGMFFLFFFIPLLDKGGRLSGVKNKQRHTAGSVCSCVMSETVNHAGEGVHGD